MLRSALFSRLFIAIAMVISVASTATQAVAQDAAYVPMDAASLQPLVAPVALYPDALLAQILVASTYPDDVVAAAQYLDGGGDPNGVDLQGWDASVAGVARYPDLVHYLASNGQWMNTLGSAWLNQQADVMAAVQVLRGQALAAGNLVSNDQQQIVTDDDGTIEIIPTNPDVIYPPIYDPALVYEQPVVVVGQPFIPLIRFWRGIPVGVWLDADLDWHDRHLYLGDWGATRPWWHHTLGPGGRFDYTHDRPGLFINGHTDIHFNAGNRAIALHGGEWNRQMHDPKKAMPRFVAPAVRGPGPRPEVHVSGAIGDYNHAPAIARQAERGRESVQRAAPHPEAARPAPEVNRSPVPARVERAPEVHEAPAAHAAPARAEPQRVEPARSEAPVRGGAVNNYGSGAAASHASDRGAASRGGGGGRR